MRRGLLGILIACFVVATFAWGPTILGLQPSPLPGSTADPTADPTASPSPSRTVDATPLAFFSSDGYTVTLPPGWTASAVGRAQQGILLELLRGSNADLADLVGEILDLSGGEVSMVGGDLGALSHGGVPPNVSVLIEPNGGQSGDVLMAATEQLIRRIPGQTGNVARTRVTLGGLPAERFEYSVRLSTGLDQVRLETYTFARGSSTYLITCASSVERFPEQQAMFDGIVKSFHLVD